MASDVPDPESALPWLGMVIALIGAVFGYGRLSQRVADLERARKDDADTARAAAAEVKDHIDDRFTSIENRLTQIMTHLLGQPRS